VISVRAMGGMLAGVLVCSSAVAQTATWDDGVDGVWNDLNNWDILMVPNGPGFSAVVDAPANPVPYVVTLDIDVTIDDLTLASADATLDGDGLFTMTVQDTALFTDVTIESVATFTTNDALIFNSADGICDDLCDTVFLHAGNSVDWMGEGNIALLGPTTFSHGAGSIFTIQSARTLDIDDGATFTNDGAIAKSSAGTTSFLRTGATGVFENPGTVEVTSGAWETDALDLASDTLAEGTWIVRGGSMLELLGQSVITNQASVTIDGPGSSFPAFDLNIAVNDTTGVIALEGATTFTTPDVFTNDGLVDVGPGSMFTVDLDSDFTNFVGGTIVGGELDLEGVFQFMDAAITTVDAGITLDGVGSAIVDENMDDAFTALDTIMPGGTLNIANGRDLVVGEPLLLIEGNLGVGPMFGGDVSTLDAAMDITQTAGTTLLQDGVITHGGMFTLDGGEIRGNGTITGGPLTNRGALRPGLSPGQLEIGPELRIENEGLVEIEIGGFIPGVEHDLINVVGFLQFIPFEAGILEIQLIDGFVPGPGDTFDVIVAQFIEGQFLEVIAPNFPFEIDAQVNYIPKGKPQIVQIEIVENCIADCNDDGMVDILDFMCFQEEWQNQTPCGDCNGDGMFDILDWVCFQGEWMQGC